ncbi:HAD family hydrolase [Vibrio kanaloae]|uniref:haloacid dehalogenase-like hydrolase n=1 Tax=Vibrio kanaloae TaxID=170673 RepID=UPI001245B8F1|nr:haloacid dehalogenase-like hydrolase [Vibrio kanaloae]KAB0460949.1 haloacid dehalogenase-like hydrolase [Vibrio kanaloae]
MTTKNTLDDKLLLIDLCNTLYKVNTWYEFVHWSGGLKTYSLLNSFLFKSINFTLEKIFNISLSRFILALYSKFLVNENTSYKDYVVHLNSNYLNEKVLNFISHVDARKIIISGTDSRIAEEIKLFFDFDDCIATVISKNNTVNVFELNIYKNKTNHIELGVYKEKQIVTDNYADFSFVNFDVEIIAVCNNEKDKEFWHYHKVDRIIESD